MPSHNVTDWLALKARIDTLVTNPTLNRYEPEEIFTPPRDTIGPMPFITISDGRNEPERLGVDPKLHSRSGTLTLSLQWPIARPASHAQIAEMAGQIADHFKGGLCLQYGQSRLRVTRDSDPMPAYADGPYRVANVRVFWSSL